MGRGHTHVRCAVVLVAPRSESLGVTLRVAIVQDTSLSRLIYEEDETGTSGNDVRAAGGRRVYTVRSTT